MSAISESSLQRSSDASAAEGEVDAFAEALGRFERGELSAEEWQRCCAVRGVYPQRQASTYMIRVKIPQGIASAEHLRALAEVGARWAGSRGHITSRQDLELHGLELAGLEPALRRLAAAGLSTFGAGGNTVRNVVACPFAGAAPDEAFDVTPYAASVTRHFSRHPLALTLPRKFKIAFEGCATDHVATSAHDLGLWARVRTAGGIVEPGFRVTAGGGTSTQPTAGLLLTEFLPAEEILILAEAIIRLFHARGDRANRQKNRLKFLIRQLGADAFRAALEEEVRGVRAGGMAALVPDQNEQRALAAPRAELPAPPLRAASGPELPSSPEAAAAYAEFLHTNVRPHRDPGMLIVSACLPQGEITSSQLESLAELALAYGEGAVRFGPDGHAILRSVRGGDAPALYARLAAAGLGRAGAGGAADIASCPGAEVCRLGVTRSREVARLIEAHLRATLGAQALGAPLSVRISGCPHGCRQHHLADIGLQGGTRKIEGRTVPYYSLLVGGGADESGARFAKPLGRVPAHLAAQAVERLASLYAAERSGLESAGAFFARSLERAKAAIAPLEDLEPESARHPHTAEPSSAEASSSGERSAAA